MRARSKGVLSAMGKSENIELVADLCPKDCVYRTTLDGGGTPCCIYILCEDKSRGCKVSECDKYKAGERVRPRMTDEYVIWWEREIYGENGDPFW